MARPLAEETLSRIAVANNGSLGMDSRHDRRISEVIDFWQDAGARGLWFAKDARFDRRFRDRFLSLHRAVAARRHDGWMETSEGALALLILTDQFPRNAFRGTGRMYSTDPLAKHYARQAQKAGHMQVKVRACPGAEPTPEHAISSKTTISYSAWVVSTGAGLRRNALVSAVRRALRVFNGQRATEGRALLPGRLRHCR